MFCVSCGSSMVEGDTFCTQCGAPVADTSAAAAPVQSQVAPGGGVEPSQWQPAGPARPRRTGLIVGCVVAAVVVAAGAGVGIWLALRGDDGAASAHSTTTVPGVTPSYATIPGLDGEGGPDTTVVPDAGAALIDYRIAVENMVMELDYANGRIPELADIINSTTPSVPQEVYNDLESMLGMLQEDYASLLSVIPPAEFIEANEYLVDAADHMISRIVATIDGVQATWDSGATSSGLPYYTLGRAERDAYLASIAEFRVYVPVGTLPGD